LQISAKKSDPAPDLKGLTTAKANRLAHVYYYNSPPAAAREVFKSSTDSASLVVPSQKKQFQFWVWGSFGGASEMGVFSRFHGLLYPALDAHRMGPRFWPKYFYETRLSYESLEPLIGFLAYLDEKLCQKKQKVFKNPTPKKGYQSGITPLLDMAITCC